MALAETVVAQPEKSQEPVKHDRKEKPQTKVVIRRLPPGITEEEFLVQVAPVPEYDYLYTINGDLSLGENAFSRVYLNLCNMEDVYMFKEKFDNYVFVDAKGHEYPAVVEYASFQKVPKKRKARIDPKIGSIESDPLYVEFVNALQEAPNQDDKPEYTFQPSESKNEEETTPLLDYLKQRKLDRMRIREERREERKKKEVERKKVREDDRKKRIEDKTVRTKTVLKEATDDKETEIKEEKSEELHEKAPPPMKKERKYEDRKVNKPKYFNKYDDRKDFKNKEHQRNKFEEPKKFDAPKKVKKYSERREERKNEAIKREENISAKSKPEEVAEQAQTKSPEKKGAKAQKVTKEEECYEEGESRHRNKENDPRMQRRIRNKDRPAMVLYKPGALRKKSIDSDSKDGDLPSPPVEQE